jgi:hypothetical protein
LQRNVTEVPRPDNFTVRQDASELPVMPAANVLVIAWTLMKKKGLV